MLLIGKGAAGASALSWQPLIPILIPTIQVAWVQYFGNLMRSVDSLEKTLMLGGIGVKAQHEGALPPPCIVRKDPRVPHTARRGA